MNTVCGGSSLEEVIKTIVSLCALFVFVSCQSDDKAREWHSADSVRAATVFDTTEVWRFDSAQYLYERLTLLEAEAANAATGKIIRDFRKVINGWVTDSLAEAFWGQVHRDHDVLEVPLVIEVGHPEDDPVYIARAIIISAKAVFLVRSDIVNATRALELEYSELTAEEYERIMRKLVENYSLFSMKSGLGGVIGDNLAMTVLQARYQGRRTLLLFSEYRRPPGDPAKAMFACLDSLFWGVP